MIYVKLSEYYVLKTEAHRTIKERLWPGVGFVGWILVGVLVTCALLVWL